MAWSDGGSGDKPALQLLHMGSLGPTPPPRPSMDKALYLPQAFQQVIDSVGPWGQPRKNSPSPPHSRPKTLGLLGVVNLRGRLRVGACRRQPLNLGPTLSTHGGGLSSSQREQALGLENERHLWGGQSLSNSRDPRLTQAWLAELRAGLMCGDAWGQLRPSASTGLLSTFLWSGQPMDGDSEPGIPPSPLCLLRASGSFSVPIGG